MGTPFIIGRNIMSYIRPTGTIQLFRGINLDNRYMHTLYFANTNNQTAFFDSLVDADLSFGENNTYRDKTPQSYIRPGIGIVRLKVGADRVQNVTYMRFNNNRSPSKWYYCFVTSINYVNENMTEISYEIDVMQTWFFQGGGINPCMVIREHVSVSDDKLKNHLEPEPVTSDVYRFDEVTPSNAGDFGGYDVVVNTTNEADSSDMIKNNIFCGTEYYSHQLFDDEGDVPGENLEAIKGHLVHTLGSWDKNEQSADVTDIYMFPHKYKDTDNETYHVKFDPTATGHTFDYSVQNMKMNAYPYSFLFATTKGGSCAQYRWEYFDSDMSLSSSSAEFHVKANGTGGGSIICYPREYNGIEDNYDANLLCDSFPKCSWSYDAYQAFVASGGQTKLQTEQKILNYKAMVTTARDLADVSKAAVAAAGATVAGAAAVATGGVLAPAAVAATVKATNVIANTGADIADRHIGLMEAQNKIDFAFADAKYAPDVAVGRQIPNLSVGGRFLGFYFYNCHVDPMEMVRIDNFFTVYGYAINTVKRPNLTGRPYWNFLQTDGAVITGDMPATSKSAISRIFDGGIFLWPSTGSPSTVNANIGNFRRSYKTTDFGEQLINR